MGTCGRCGAVSAAGATFCASCGAPLTTPQTYAAPGVPAYGAPTPPARPVGVTLVGAAILVGAGFLAFGGLVAFAFIVFGAGFASFFEGFGGGFMSALGGAFVLIGMVILIAVGVMVALAIVVGVGVLRGRPWAWVGTLVILGFIALGGLADLADMDPGGLLGLAVAGLVGWYFFRPEVKQYFQRT